MVIIMLTLDEIAKIGALYNELHAQNMNIKRARKLISALFTNTIKCYQNTSNQKSANEQLEKTANPFIQDALEKYFEPSLGSNIPRRVMLDFIRDKYSRAQLFTDRELVREIRSYGVAYRKVRNGNVFSGIRIIADTDCLQREDSKKACVYVANFSDERCKVGITTREFQKRAMELERFCGQEITDYCCTEYLDWRIAREIELKCLKNFVQYNLGNEFLSAKYSTVQKFLIDNADVVQFGHA